jgi:hypothetical protein
MIVGLNGSAYLQVASQHEFSADDDEEACSIQFGQVAHIRGSLPTHKLTAAQARSLIQWSIDKLKDAVGTK